MLLVDINNKPLYVFKESTKSLLEKTDFCEMQHNHSLAVPVPNNQAYFDIGPLVGLMYFSVYDVEFHPSAVNAQSDPRLQHWRSIYKANLVLYSYTLLAKQQFGKKVCPVIMTSTYRMWLSTYYHSHSRCWVVMLDISSTQWAYMVNPEKYRFVVLAFFVVQTKSCSPAPSTQPYWLIFCVSKLTSIGSDNGLFLVGAKPLSESMPKYR